MRKRRVLICGLAPQFDRDSGSRRVYDLILMLREAGWAVTFVSYHPAEALRYVEILRQRGVAAYSGARWVEDLLPVSDFDLAIFCLWHIAEAWLPVVRRMSPRTRIIIDSVDVHLLRNARRALCEQIGDGALGTDFAAEMIREVNTYVAADAILTVSQKEAEFIGDFTGGRASAFPVPDCEDLSPSPIPFAERAGILFVGFFRHSPNVSAAKYLLDEIVPRLDPDLLKDHPIHIVGDGLDEDLLNLGKRFRQVRMVGWVPSVVPYFERTRISIIPLLYGAGTKRKMIQALMTGTPTVASSIGAEGLNLRDGEHFLLAEDPQTFSEAITRLLTEPALWSRLAEQGRAQILASHDRIAARAQLVRIVDAVLSKKPRLKAGPPLVARAVALQDQRQLIEQLPRTADDSLLQEVSIEPASPPEFHHREADSPPPEQEFPVRLIAFYLPQYHPIPENDQWWGRGFTDWTNVTKARPLFPGHYQPHLPAELGYYDLTMDAVRQAQADLARAYGIFGFAYYHYWFHGRRLLERPFAEVLFSRRPDFPFCLCWANEPWTRRWDGRDSDVLQQQSYSEEDDRAHISFLLDALRDPRAIAIDGKPLFMIYQAQNLPDPVRTTDIWRGEVEKAGLPGLYLIAVETGWDEGWDATQAGFDAKILFQPQFTMLRTAPRLAIDGEPELQVYDYQDAWPILANPIPVSYRRFDTVFPSWDNTSRQGRRGVVLDNSSPAAYEEWLTLAIARAQNLPHGERFVFLNAWNEWAEGAHLEPDMHHGHAYLEATKRALMASANSSVQIPFSPLRR